jgi:TatA/E family protein of Tat protein translocase
MGFIKALGNTFYYEEQGEGSPILLIPPAGSTASTWGALVDDLAGAGRVIAYDRRGYTRSGGEVVRSAAEHTRDAAAVLDALKAGPVVAAGTSAGATIALDLAVRRPDLVRAVVVHEAAWRALRHPDASGLGTLARMQWLAWRGRYPEAAETLLRWVYSYRDGGSAWDAFPEQWRQTARANGGSVIADLKSSMGSYPRAQDLAAITAPVVCTYGSRSRGYMRPLTRSLAQAIPTASVRVIDGTAHAVPFDAPGLRQGHRRSDALIGGAFGHLRFPPSEGRRCWDGCLPSLLLCTAVTKPFRCLSGPDAAEPATTRVVRCATCQGKIGRGRMTMGFSGLSPWHVLIVVAVFVLLFGARKLPDAARSLGRSMRILKAETKALRDDDSGDEGQAPAPGQHEQPRT